MKGQVKTILPAIIIFMITILSLAQLIISNKLTSDSLELAKIDEEISWLKDKNTLLAEHLSLETSLANIASKAALLGLVKNEGVLSILGSSKVAKVR